MEAIKFIGSLILGIGILLIVGYLMSFITGGISKMFGTTSTLNGRVVATPDTLDDNIRELKEIKNKFVTAIQKYKSNNTKDDIGVSEQIRLLAELDTLKSKNVISDQEYTELRSKIIKG